MPLYQTDLLAAYAPAFQHLASDLFRRVSVRVPLGNCVTYPGSYSVTGASLPDVVGKLIIYQRDIGTPAGPFPALADGVYVLVRVNGPSGARIWIPEMQTFVFPQFFGLMSPATTLGVAPARSERFGYFPATVPTNVFLVDSYSEQIALLLEACHRLC
ncbi:MAG: hypothetical protein L0387_19845 [Acidobacteria bacterium]|nr:hypothetical protein [Acidobacteriota bacterium]